MALGGAPVVDLHTQRSAAFYVMHGRLVEWGKVLLQGAKADEPDARDEQPPMPKKIWTPTEESRAWAVDRLVRALTPRDQIVMRVFYKAREAEYWEKIEEEEQLQILTDLCREFNARWRTYCAQTQQLPVTLRGYHFGPIREAAVQELCRKVLTIE